MSCRIFICHHKSGFAPKSDILIPIQVGKSLSKKDLCFQGDDTGDNISAKNPYFCELTATYWIWKNVNADIVGLFHYRRFLNFTGGEIKFHTPDSNFADKYGITETNIKSILKDYDLIVPLKSKPGKISVYDYYGQAHHASDMDLVLDVIKQKYPSDYEIAVNELKNNSQMFIGNILIAGKKVFDAYAEWLFSILFEVEKKIQADVITRDSYQQRAYGFLAERLMGVFIATHKELKVKALPLIFWEEDAQKWRKYRLKQLKRKILGFLGIKKYKLKGV